MQSRVSEMKISRFQIENLFSKTLFVSISYEKYPDMTYL